MNQQMRQAVAALYEMASSIATPAQVLEVANKFDVEVWQLEGFYFDHVEACAE